MTSGPVPTGSDVTGDASSKEPGECHGPPVPLDAAATHPAIAMEVSFTTQYGSCFHHCPLLRPPLSLCLLPALVQFSF